MNDLAAIGFFFACLIATLGPLRLCEWLRPPKPREHARTEPGPGALPKESRQ